uniref:CDC42 effector protein (Rho GTPase binding) 5 n=1 Tax=Fundulus heteroclitus TaxID=8078 RepID=A0A3Q2PPL7_FUNHE
MPIPLERRRKKKSGKKNSHSSPLHKAMPLHKSSRAHRLDPTMISAPMGDFRHTMHIGRGGDAFGDTSFLSTAGPSPTASELGSPGIMPAADLEVAAQNHGDLRKGAPESPRLPRSDSSSSFTMDLDLDLDLDLGPSILGDVLGVMDGLSLGSNGEDPLSPKGGTSEKARHFKRNIQWSNPTKIGLFGLDHRR